MPVSLFDNPSAVFSPFTRKELERLRRYAGRVERLVGLRFFKQQESLEIMGKEDGVVTVGHDGFDEEALMAVSGLFRMLYSPQEKSSFTATINLLSAHVREDAPNRAAVLSELRELKRGRDELLRRADIRMIVERHHRDGSVTEEQMTTETVIDLWLHGQLLHSENEKSDRPGRVAQQTPPVIRILRCDPTLRSSLCSWSHSRRQGARCGAGCFGLGI